MPSRPKRSRLRAILLIGPPASGKGTHGHLLGQFPGYVHFSMGAAFRSRVPRTPGERSLLKKISRETALGNLAPDAVALKIFRQAIEELVAQGAYEPSQQTLILDGIPRTSPQAIALRKTVDIRKVFVLECPESEIFKRIRDRAKKEGRGDDANLDIVRNRLSIYTRHLGPLLKAFPPGRIVRIHSNRPAHRVFRSLLEHID